MSYLYGLDLSLTCTGIAIIDLEKQCPILVDSIATKKNKKVDDYTDHKERLKLITDKYDSLISVYPPSMVAIESPFVEHNNSTKATMKVHGVTQRWFYSVPQFYYAPNAIKKTIAGNGHATKELLQQILERKYPYIKFKNDNESDALAIAITHMVKAKIIKNWSIIKN